MSEDVPDQASSEDEDDSSSVGDEDEAAQPVESLVFGRSRRVTAGNRLSSLLEKEADDELELLFAENEEEEDVEFQGEDGADGSDVQLDSSSDEEDKAPAKSDDDLEGEKELQKQGRVERQKKRKAHDVFRRPGGLPKKAKIDPTAAVDIPVTPAPRQRKKSERVSWIPTPDEGPTRSSSRKQTVQNKEVIHLRMVQSEKRRVQQITIMEAAAKRKEASKPKAMTQADRMAEAARTEEKNAKSLNRWEETEKKRAEEQKAKLEALHNRQLSGPVVSWWSGLARWVNGKLEQVGVRAIRESGEIEGITGDNHEDKDKMPERVLDDHPNESMEQDTVMTDIAQPQSLASPSQQPESTDPSQQIRFAPPQGPHGFLDGIHYYASLPAPSREISKPSELVSPMAPEPVSAPPPLTRPPTSVIEYSTRNLVTFKNIDANAMKIPELQNHALLKKRTGKLQSQCPAMYRSNG